MIEKLLWNPMPRMNIETERLILRPIRMRDARDLYAYAKQEEVARFVLWNPHTSVSDSRRFIRSCIRQYHAGMPGTFAIEHRQDGHMIGTIGFVAYSGEHRCAEIGYSLNPKYWNNGYMTESLKALIRYSFDTLHLHRIEACHDIRNPASGQVMKNSGMHPEGTLRDRYFNKGSYCTVDIYAILKDDRSSCRQEDG